jgi:DNA-directed RNA polymerase specialized sigma24 family protein
VDLPPFQSLLDAHGRDVHRFLIASVGAVEADDCYQETWLAALRAYPRLRDASNLRGWILTVAHRKAIDHHRARTRRAVPVGEPEMVAAGSGAGTGGGVAGALALPEDGSGLWGQVAALAPKQRAALALRFVADAGYEQIAAVMDTSEEAARRNVHEGLTKLRKEYGQR